MKEFNSKKKSEIKKENSYDVSDSDFEYGSVDRFNIDGDYGYEIGFFDDSDVSVGELFSLLVKDENKIILINEKSGNFVCIYIEVEFG